MALGGIGDPVRAGGVSGPVPLDVDGVDGRLAEVESPRAARIHHQNVGAQAGLRALHLKGWVLFDDSCAKM